MRVALIGSRGQLGHDILASWRQDEIEPLASDRLDVTDRAQTLGVLRACRPELVVNTAAFTRVDDCESQAGAAFAVNTLGALHVAQAARELDADLLHISTDYVFAGDSDRPYTESDAPSPVNVYGASKLAGEVLVRLACERRYIVRSSGLYGVAGASGKGGNFVEAMLRLAGEGREIAVVDDQELSPTYTADLAAKLRELVAAARSGTYHITNSGSCTWYQFAKRVFALAGVEPDLRSTTSRAYGAPARRPAYSVLDNAAIRTLGLAPLRSWEEALEAYLRAKGHIAGRK
jgi:dTDP-4-dehydrorhamnose reductase